MKTGWIGTLILGAAAFAANAEEFEQHGAHEHGRITFNIAVEQNTLAIELEAPAANVVGFEHEPRTDAERKAVSDASALFKSGHGLFGVPKSAGCSLAQAETHAPGSEESLSEEHEHESGPQHHEEGHQDYHARFLYRCAAPEKLAWIELWILRKLRDVTEANVNVLTSSTQTSERVTSATARVPLRRDRSG